MKSCVDMKVGEELPKTLFAKEQRHRRWPSVTTKGTTSSGSVCSRTWTNSCTSVMLKCQKLYCSHLQGGLNEQGEVEFFWGGSSLFVWGVLSMVFLSGRQFVNTATWTLESLNSGSLFWIWCCYTPGRKSIYTHKVRSVVLQLLWSQINEKKKNPFKTASATVYCFSIMWQAVNYLNTSCVHWVQGSHILCNPYIILNVRYTFSAIVSTYCPCSLKGRISKDTVEFYSQQAATWNMGASSPIDIKRSGGRKWNRSHC